MSRRKKHSQSKLAEQLGAAHDLPRRVLLLLLAGLCVARALLPSEGVAWLGDGQPFVLGWLVLGAGYLAWALVRGRLARPLDAIDASVLALVAFCSASALMGFDGGNPRYALNMLGEWVALGLVFLLTRQLISTEREARALVAVMIAVAVAVSAFGLYQVFVTLPADRAAYAADPEAAMERLGQWFAPGSPERINFENRLKSTEPMGTFALANSLAGFLAAWLIVLVGVGWSVLAGEATSELEGEASRIGLGRGTCLVGIAAAIATIAVCFVLTKSRGAYLAMLVGVALLPLCRPTRRLRLNTRFVAAAGLAILVLVVGATVAGGLDARVLTEAGKSLGYRLEYWQATLSMIWRYPSFGVGPGNFQDYYTQFKLPQASEEVRDPHNFLLEVWSTAGTYALVALVCVLVLLARRVWYAPIAEDLPQLTPKRSSEAPADSNASTLYILAGAALGVLGAFVLGPQVGWPLAEVQILAGLAIGAMLVAALWPWINSGRLWPRLPALGVLVLLVNLLVAGGIAFPSVASTLWILAAFAANLCAPSVVEPVGRRVVLPARRGRLLLALVAVVLAAIACLQYSVRPMFRLQHALADVADAERRGAAPQMVSLFLLEAIKADPLASEPFVMLCDHEKSRLDGERAVSQSLGYVKDRTESMISLRPHSSELERLAGQWFGALYAHTGDQQAANAAAAHFKSATSLYPNSAALQAEYALSLHMAGRADQAKSAAQAALNLDGQTPHADKKLAPALKRQIERLAEGAN